MIRNDRCNPDKKASATRGETASKLGSTPNDPIVTTTTVVATAMLVTLAEFLMSWVKEETTP
jgi:hypothetical protein